VFFCKETTSESIQDLKRASALQLSSMALAGYAAKDEMWRGMCEMLVAQVEHPYLKCCFGKFANNNNTLKKNIK
jgi:hypothetical protein